MSWGAAQKRGLPALMMVIRPRSYSQVWVGMDSRELSSEDPIRVLVVDEHSAVRETLATVISAFDGLEVAGQAATATEAFAACEVTHPDVVLMDLSLPDMDPCTAVRRFHRDWPRVQILALCSFWDEGQLRDVLQAKAAGYVLKNVTADELAQAIYAAHDGDGDQVE